MEALRETVLLFTLLTLPVVFWMVLSVIVPCEERLRRTVLPEEAERFTPELDAERPTEEAEPVRDEAPEPATVLLMRPSEELRVIPRPRVPAPVRETEVLPIPMP